MKVIEFAEGWFSEHPFTFNILKYLIWLFVIAAVIAFLRKLIKRKLPDNSIRYRSQKGIEIIGYFFIILLTISYFTGNIKDFALSIGLLTAGITITLQELILSIAGSFYIFFVKVYKPGDRIEINSIKGDVIDVDSIYTTMMEIGEWISSDNYSGRIVKISNSFVFKGPVYNYSQDFPFVWDEFNIPIKYGSDVELAKKIVINVATEVLSDYVNQSITHWENVVKKFYIENANVEPTLAIKITDNWIEFNLRYIVDYKKRRITKNELNTRIEEEIRKLNGQVHLASATMEIISIPKINVSGDFNNSGKS